MSHLLLTPVLALASLLPSLPSQVATTQRAQGTVFHDRNHSGLRDAGEPGVPGVLVSNGRDVVRCDDDGRYEIPVSDDCIVFVIKPRGWRTPTDRDQVPRFYYLHKPQGSPQLRYPGVAATGPLPESIDFPLYAQRESPRFRVVLFGDTQPRTEQEVDYLARDIVPELVDVDAAFGMTLGDIVFDRLELLTSVKQVIGRVGVPWHYVYGNHDMNLDATDENLADETFERVFGPTNYAFQRGNAHFVILDNVVWSPARGGRRGGYRGGFDEDAMTFVRNYLEHVPRDELVVLAFHIQLDDSSIDRPAFFELLKDHPHSLTLSAHTHIHRTVFLGQEHGYRGPDEHVHLNLVTTCGSWWKGKTDELGIPITRMADGAPNGYGILEIDDTRWSLRFKAARRPAGYQMDVHVPSRVPLANVGDTEVVVNVFNGSERSKVWMRINDRGEWTSLRQVRRPDPCYVALKDEEAQLQKLWRAALATGMDLAGNGSGETSDLERRIAVAWRTQRRQFPWAPLPNPAPSTHLWAGPLPSTLPIGPHLLRVRTEDMFGEVHEACRVLRVTER